MPVECSYDIERKNQEAFYAIDFEVMGHAFDIHNWLGRFLDESIYNISFSRVYLKSYLPTGADFLI